MSSPELPFLAAGAVSLVGGVVKEHGFPSHGVNAVVGTVALVIVASATSGTSIAPLVHAIGLLLLMASVYGTTRAYQTHKKG